MKTFRLLFLPLIAGATLQLANAQSIWTGANHETDINWSDAGNWTGGAPSADTVTFPDGAFPVTTNMQGAVNNIVQSSTAITSLAYNNLGGSGDFVTTQISPSQTLTVDGALTMSGGGTNAIMGPGGALVVNNNTATVAVGSTQAVRPGLDMSGLDTFTATAKLLQVGEGASFSGALTLAKTNSITITGPANLTTGNSNPLLIGGATSSTTVGTSLLLLGQSNAIYVDGIVLGTSKSSGDTIAFNPALTSPTAYFRGTNGNASRITLWAMGDDSVNVSTGTPGSNYTNDFSAGSLDAMVTTLTVGQGAQAKTTTRTTAGNFLLGAGTLNVTTLTIGLGGIGTGGGVGRLTVNTGGTVLANTIGMALPGGATGGGLTATTGTLTINGGTVDAETITAGSGTGGSTISATSGTLAVSNTLAASSAQLTTLALTNATIYLTPGTGGSTVNASVATLAPGGTTNTLDVIPNSSTWLTPIVITGYP